jgi:hypothetical protein
LAAFLREKDTAGFCLGKSQLSEVDPSLCSPDLILATSPFSTNTLPFSTTLFSVVALAVVFGTPLRVVAVLLQMAGAGVVIAVGVLRDRRNKVNKEKEDSNTDDNDCAAYTDDDHNDDEDNQHHYDHDETKKQRNKIVKKCFWSGVCSLWGPVNYMLSLLDHSRSQTNV